MYQHEQHIMWVITFAENSRKAIPCTT